jgi:hypothetical protein
MCGLRTKAANVAAKETTTTPLQLLICSIASAALQQLMMLQCQLSNQTKDQNSNIVMTFALFGHNSHCSKSANNTPAETFKHTIQLN